MHAILPANRWCWNNQQCISSQVKKAYNKSIIGELFAESLYIKYHLVKYVSPNHYEFKELGGEGVSCHRVALPENTIICSKLYDGFTQQPY